MNGRWIQGLGTALLPPWSGQSTPCKGRNEVQTLSGDTAQEFVCQWLGRSSHSSLCKTGSPKKEKKINIFELEETIPSDLCWYSLCPKRWHETKP